METIDKKWLQRLSLLATIFAWLVIGLGAFTRLKAAGLGCPDWPGCYGHLIPNTAHSSKAWIEMIHRYCAGTLVLLILGVSFLCVLRAVRQGGSYLIWCLFVFMVVIYQALLGMWTVTLKLWPTVVSQHLLGGMIIFSLLCVIHLKSREYKPKFLFNTTEKMAALGAGMLVFLQVALGAWTSTNYAGISCASFPFCHAGLMHYDYAHAFNFTLPIGINYEGGILNEWVRQTIQMTHRFGALVVSLYLIAFTIYLLMKYPQFRKWVLFLLVILCSQIILGIANVVWQLPLFIAVLHNLFAALLLGITVALNYFIFARPQQEYDYDQFQYHPT